MKYKDDFTIRWSRPSGIKTEYQKIMEGLVDYILYGFVNELEDKIIHYFIGDLVVFRETNPNPFSVKPNNPHDSNLAVFRLCDLPDNFVLKLYTKEVKH